MIKCQSCRDKDVELLTWGERVRNWWFRKINSLFFTDDFEDLKTQKYTQGFADGNIEGNEKGKLRAEKEFALYAVEPHKPSDEELDQRLNDLLSNVDLHKIVTLDKTGILRMGGEMIDQARINNLRAEAEFLEQSDIWGLLTETPKELAQRSLFVEGDSLDNLKKGRTILYTLSTQGTILKTLLNTKK